MAFHGTVNSTGPLAGLSPAELRTVTVSTTTAPAAALASTELSKVVRLVSLEQKNAPNVVGVILGERKLGLEVVGGVFVRLGGGANAPCGMPPKNRLKVKHFPPLIARLRVCGHCTECRELEHC